MSATMTAHAEPMEKTLIAPQRIQSVDILRGLTIALMILVNNPGDWDHVFRQLDHAEWNGWTLTDLVFPTFLFLVGASLVFSLAARTARGDCRGTLAGRLFARTGRILLLQIVLVLFPRMHWQGMRLYGVLPRIALCYLLAGLLLLAVSHLQPQRSRVICISSIVFILLTGYWILLRWVPVPGAGVPVRDIPFLDTQANLVSWADRGISSWTMRWLHVGKLYRTTRDPEGLLSTLPAVASTLLGSLAAMWMRSRLPRARVLLSLAAAGLVSVVAGTVWSWSFPINKNLWTSSYVLLAAGFAALSLAALSWLVDARSQPWPRWLRAVTWPWLVFGSNAIAAFAFSAMLVKLMLAWKVTDTDGDTNTMWGTIYEKVFSRNGSTNWTSLAFAACFVFVCFLPNLFLWRRKWFLKI